MKKYIKEISIMSAIILILPLIFSIFNIFEIEIPVICYLLTITIFSFVSGLIVGRNSKSDAYKKGLLLGIIFITTMFLLSIILRSTLSVNMIIYYLIVIIASTLGSMIGIQKR